MDPKLKYIAGTFLVQANEAFLNGGGLAAGEDQTTTMPKFMWVNGQKVPYVSSQSWKHWLRSTLIEETGWDSSPLRAVGWNQKGNTAKIAGMLNPIDYREDDIFGYMFAFKLKDVPKTLTEEQQQIIDTLPKTQVVRPAIFLASLLAAIQTKGALSKDDAFVHLSGDSTPLPYTTGFYNADLNAIFGIDVSRLGVFNNLDETEINPELIDPALEAGKIELQSPETPKDNNAMYRMVNIDAYRKECICSLIGALGVLRGGAKLAQFGVDVSPKVLICVGLDFCAPILNNLFELDETDKPRLNIELLTEIMGDYKGRVTTKLIIGIRKDYLANDAEVRELKNIDDIEVVITTPTQVATVLGESL